MRQHKILSRTLLILSIIKFALAAPAAVRERREVRLDANVAKNVKAASQKRSISDSGGSPNVPGLDHAPLPPSPDLTDVLRQMAEHLAEQHRYPDSPPSLPDSPGSLTGSDYVPPSPGLPTGSHPGPTGGSPLLLLPYPGPSEDSFPPGFSEKPDIVLVPSPPGWAVNPGTLSSTGHQRTPPQSPSGFPLLPLPHQEPSEDSFPTGFPPGSSENLDTLSSTGSTGNQPTTPQSADPEIHSLLNLEPFPTEFWDKFLNGRIKRRSLLLWIWPRRTQGHEHSNPDDLPQFNS